MDKVYYVFAILILITVMLGLFRVFLGPTRADRMLAAQLCGTASVAIFLILGCIDFHQYLFNLAFVFALLSSVSSITFLHLTWHQMYSKKEGALNDE